MKNNNETKNPNREKLGVLSSTGAVVSSLRVSPSHFHIPADSPINGRRLTRQRGQVFRLRGAYRRLLLTVSAEPSVASAMTALPGKSEERLQLPLEVS